MSELQTQLSKARSQILGTESKFQSSVEGIVYYFERRIEPHCDDYNKTVMGVYEEIRGHGEIKRLQKSCVNSFRRILSLLGNGKIELDEFERSSRWMEFVFIENNFPGVVTDFYVTPTGKWLDKVLSEYLEREFHNEYQGLWELSLLRAGPFWNIFLESKESTFKKQKGLFRFYWTLYKLYFAARLLALHDESFKLRCNLNLADHLVEQNEAWLLRKCYSSRIKITTDLLERELVDHISYVWNEFIEISSVENFVNSNFSYRNSEHSVKLLPYTIIVKKTASKFLTFLREKDLILRNNKFRGKGNELSNKPVEIQLWLEFIFRGHKGFNQNSIEEYYLPKRSNKILR